VQAVLRELLLLVVLVPEDVRERMRRDRDAAEGVADGA
jgi:hypothetical protein